MSKDTIEPNALYCYQCVMPVIDEGQTFWECDYCENVNRIDIEEQN